MQRLQTVAAAEPDGRAARSARRCRSTPRSSFVTNTNWQSYYPETTMSHFTQMAGLAVQNFVSPAVGIAVVVALIRGLARRRSDTIGNFWVDLTRGDAARAPARSRSSSRSSSSTQGVVQNLHGFEVVQHARGQHAGDPRRAERRARKRSRSSAPTAAGSGTSNSRAPALQPERLHRTSSRSTCSRSSGSR